MGTMLQDYNLTADDFGGEEYEGCPEMLNLHRPDVIREVHEAYLEAGITPLFHFDSDWTPLLEYFKEFPRGTCILELDGTTDIFKAKEVLRDHMCLMGDVPAALLKLGTPEEVSDYVKKLIDVVGEGGGFILSTGCDTPVDAKPENVRAMVETALTYQNNR
jgi:uroporphyrinogen-III decarboxylase